MPLERLKDVIMNTVQPGSRPDRSHSDRSQDRSHPGQDQRQEARRHDTRHENQHRQSRPPSDEPMTPEDLREKIQLLERENARLSEELRNERGQAEKLHSQRDVQLESLKEFLDTHDKSGQSDVISAVDLLNDVVDQFASDVADQFQPSPIPAKVAPELGPEGRLKPASARLLDVLGEPLVKILESCGPDHSILFQYATQAAVLRELAQNCDIHFSGRFGDGVTALSLVFNDLAQRVQRQEIQPIYARWRALTHRHLRAAVLPEAAEEQREKFVDDVSRIIVDIHDTFFGVESPVDTRSTFRATFGSGLIELHKSASQFATMIREDVITTDYSLVSPLPHAEFHRMDYPYEPRRRPSKQDSVICTIKFGLISKGKRGRERVEIEERQVKRPQVFTFFILEDIVGPTNKVESA